jgi:hypothetical protein
MRLSTVRTNAHYLWGYENRTVSSVNWLYGKIPPEELSDESECGRPGPGLLHSI